MMKKEAHAEQFDRLGLKREIWDDVTSGRIKLQSRRLGTLARVVYALPAGVKEPSWDLWARIFQWFGPAASGQPWRVIWYAAATPRTFPAIGQDLGPEHVNGGYTRPCSTDGIIIYRAEEATRVLVHELLHAACLDEVGWSIPLREAQIEVWAELFLIALVAKGRTAAAERLWAKQAQWVADVNWKAETMHGASDLSDYAWRYLKGREVMYARLGVALPPARPEVARAITSLRFTTPALEPSAI
jgi:hypothetical protein